MWVYAPSGDLLGKVRAPEKVANLAWGGPDFRTLFLTATHSVYRIATKVGPRREPYMSRGRTPAAAARRKAPKAAVLAGAVARQRSDARPEPLRAHHSGHAE